MTTTYKVFLTLLVLAMLALVGTMDRQDAQVAEDQYCDMVSSGAWPDYKDNYGAVCAGRE